MMGTVPKRPFHLDEYIQEIQKKSTDTSRRTNAAFNRLERFYEICDAVKEVIKMEMLDGIGTGSAEADQTNQFLYQQKRAIIGHTKEVNYFKTKIEEYLKKTMLRVNGFLIGLKISNPLYFMRIGVWPGLWNGKSK